MNEFLKSAFAVVFTGAFFIAMANGARADDGCTRALNGIGVANGIIVDVAKTGTLDQRFYDAVEYHAACLSVAHSRCGDNDGFASPPPTAQSVEQCAGVLETSLGQSVETIMVKSQFLGQGVYYAKFFPPIDIFNPAHTQIVIVVDNHIDPKRQLNGSGDNLLIMDGHGEGSYRCKGAQWFDDIAQDFPLDNIWNGSTYIGSGPTNRDHVEVVKKVNCQAIANEPFTIMITYDPSDLN